MKSNDIQSIALSRASLTSCLLVLLLGATHSPGGVAQRQSGDLMKEYLDTDRHVYTVLERVPNRHWGDRNLAAQFWQLRDEISKRTKAGNTLSQEEVKSLGDRFEQSCSRVLNQLKINTAGTVSFARTGKPVFDAEAV
jgi:hypothetical protein